MNICGFLKSHYEIFSIKDRKLQSTCITLNWNTLKSVKMQVVCPQNKLRVIKGTFPYVVCGATPTRFLPLYRESNMKRFPSKIWHLKFSFLSFAKFAICLKNHVLLILLTSGLLVINGT